MQKVTFRLIFWGSAIFLAVVLWTITVGQSINYEFQNDTDAGDFYNIILGGTPIAILLTLFGTLKRNHNTRRKILTIITTLGGVVFSFMFLLYNFFTIGFGVWTTFNIAYEHKSNPERKIREQRYDVGALGYGATRVVEVNSFTSLFWKVTLVDTTKLSKVDWTRVDKDGDIKFP